MSRIGKLPVVVPAAVEVAVENNILIVKGPKGSLSFSLPAGISLERDGEKAILVRSNEEQQTRAFHGLVRAMLANMILGVTKGFEKKLEIIGVGYRAQATGTKINLSLGFSHPVEMDAPAGITVEMDKDLKNVVVISGIDKQAVGEFAANIRKLRKPEPYKGKGVRYLGEYVRRKAGKSASKKK